VPFTYRGFVRKAVGYARVSTVDQAEDGVSLDAQEQRIRAWCALNDYELVDVKVDRGLSGGRADNRPALQEALLAVGRGDALVVYSLSRLARSTKDTIAIAETLDRRGADLVSLSEKIETTTAAGKMLFRLLAVLAEFERDVVAERTSMAIRHMQSIGKFIGGDLPFGFRVVDGWMDLVPGGRTEGSSPCTRTTRRRALPPERCEGPHCCGVLDQDGPPVPPQPDQKDDQREDPGGHGDHQQLGHSRLNSFGPAARASIDSDGEGRSRAWRSATGVAGSSHAAHSDGARIAGIRWCGSSAIS
jgi:DNA invertase Pin-like site-specific DNA recombinase